MSRAFVKEPDGSEIEELPEKPVSSHRNLVTPDGLIMIENHMQRLNDELADAQAAGNKLLVSQLQRDLRYWSSRRSTAELVPYNHDSNEIRFGMEVSLKRESGKITKFRIVGEDEADPSKGLISYVSPVASSLIGKQIGDYIVFADEEAEIISIG